MVVSNGFEWVSTKDDLPICFDQFLLWVKLPSGNHRLLLGSRMPDEAILEFGYFDTYSSARWDVEEAAYQVTHWLQVEPPEEA